MCAKITFFSGGSGQMICLCCTHCIIMLQSSAAVVAGPSHTLGGFLRMCVPRPCWVTPRLARKTLSSLLHPVGTRWQTIVLDTARFLKWKQFVFYTEQGSVARFLWLGRQLCFLNPMKWLCVRVFVCVCPSLEALVYWWFKSNQVVRAYYSALFKFYVRQLRINSVCAGVCLLTLLHRMSTVSVCCCPLWLPLIQPLFSGQKPISHLPVREVHHEGFFSSSLSFLSTFPFAWSCPTA